MTGSLAGLTSLQPEEEAGEDHVGDDDQEDPDHDGPRRRAPDALGPALDAEAAPRADAADDDREHRGLGEPREEVHQRQALARRLEVGVRSDVERRDRADETA